MRVRIVKKDRFWACRGCLIPSPCVTGVLTLSLDTQWPFYPYPWHESFILHNIASIYMFSCISSIFLVSRFNRLGGNSDLSYLSVFPPSFGVLSQVSSSDHLLIVNLISDRCTRALAASTDDRELTGSLHHDSKIPIKSTINPLKSWNLYQTFTTYQSTYLHPFQTKLQARKGCVPLQRT